MFARPFIPRTRHLITAIVCLLYGPLSFLIGELLGPGAFWMVSLALIVAIALFHTTPGHAALAGAAAGLAWGIGCFGLLIILTGDSDDLTRADMVTIFFMLVPWVVATTTVASMIVAFPASLVAKRPSPRKDVCPTCEYPTVGLPLPRCPECGTALASSGCARD